nr:PREDICTED: speckle targeted PIP5K1A-regulated poly(A) polymerase-like [Bemisia tabaci]XP_018917438.1 PREDICTED: speckle targeted PIP5K1A-regulated poly(A) polymerase-like [Bemisia tabaci]XP_018917439.1 PREDICTED: speckle targeted PIP5K1A-regulated poly(A) polymerase-like [Bemisia tabaci]XP_018917440.1 PREDICTED: speckle targeted PIP5K1A-regulated poly(A) polymerase-like [Bemisia tabaci]XP_018917441.1 PREDICTED: speckle targeted PIP5K1A-regulated poly(A) polymerase-like [Bemisia tabaci]XP_01
MSSSRSSSPSKIVRISYTDSTNDLQIHPENNIYKLNPDTLSRLIIGKKLKDLIVHSRQDVSETWSDVASSSSEDSADESEQRSSSHPEQNGSQPSDNPESSSSNNQCTDNLENSGTKTCSETVRTDSVSVSNKEDISSVNLNNLNVSKSEVFITVPLNSESAERSSRDSSFVHNLSQKKKVPFKIDNNLPDNEHQNVLGFENETDFKKHRGFNKEKELSNREKSSLERKSHQVDRKKKLRSQRKRDQSRLQLKVDKTNTLGNDTGVASDINKCFSRATTNSKHFLVPYGSTEESCSDDEGNSGKAVLNHLRSNPEAVSPSTPLANILVFPLKMEQNTFDDSNWIKCVGEADTLKLFETLTPILSNAGKVKQCLTDASSPAAFIQFENSDSMHKLLNAHNKAVNVGEKPGMKLIKIDLLGGSSGHFRGECSALMSDKRKFMEMITLSVNSMVAELNSSTAKSRRMALVTSIKKAIKTEYTNCAVFDFGSRVSGLASVNSDFDFFVDLTGQMYWGSDGYYDEINSKKETCKHIFKIKKILRNNQEFTDIKAIPTARVPILKITHVPTDSHCDLSFKNGLCVENTKLICKYLNMNFKIRWVIVAVKYWAQVCALASSVNFTNYALTWMVLFYLMTKKLIPPVSCMMDLQSKDQPLIQGWKYKTTDVGAIEIFESEESLLQGFFGYYARFEYNELAICPRLGRTLPKNIIVNCIESKMPPELQDYVSYVHQNANIYKCDDTICCIQDPLLLNHNITKQVSVQILREFRKYCDIANLKMLSWNK